jgi:hypothetical protein
MVKSLIFCVVCLTSLRSQRRWAFRRPHFTRSSDFTAQSRFIYLLPSIYSALIQAWICLIVEIAHSSLNPVCLAIFKFSSSPPSSPCCYIYLFFNLFHLSFCSFLHIHVVAFLAWPVFFFHWVLTLHRGFNAPMLDSFIFPLILSCSSLIYYYTSNCTSHSFASTNIVTGAVSRLCICLKVESCLGNATGYPGIFQGNPSPYPWKPTPTAKGVGFRGYGVWVYSNLRVSKPIRVWVVGCGNYFVFLLIYNYGHIKKFSLQYLYLPPMSPCCEPLSQICHGRSRHCHCSSM